MVIVFFKIVGVFFLLIGFSLMIYGAIRCFIQMHKVASRVKNPYLPWNYGRDLKFHFKNGIMFILIGLLIIFFAAAILNYLSYGYFGFGWDIEEIIKESCKRCP